jgi:hypothetical protein
MEKEEHLKLPFLDIMVERLDNKPVFVVYRKATSTQRYITADSFHQQSHKNVQLFVILYGTSSVQFQIV